MDAPAQNSTAYASSPVWDLGPDFKNSKCLNLCELHLILGDQLRLNTRRSSETQSNLEREGDLQPYETAMLVNLLPRTSDEAKALIPSLTRLSNERLMRILIQLEQHRAHAR
ncbi:Dna-directed Rna polymerase II RPB4 [Cardiosporidium cionae]|uniref:Dna-directed Rna polymerase II RPB4 n=1 Tax=Cardiosporidium cionae TaxID=476202 RepID=A0ABQ7JE95_9APIC|nr:Dna-directed Rna polymerase II RPB4 [Cardiosporidium cionae]|eukprot:KAF8822316.1 Dna-directed Rna polymerase II RPB4 [Cardiosporidium cionae]